MLRAIQYGAPNIGRTAPAICTSSHATDQIQPALRMHRKAF